MGSDSPVAQPTRQLSPRSASCQARPCLPDPLSFGLAPRNITSYSSSTPNLSRHYSIAGLPPGVRAIACSGADVTPVRATTWGRVKSIYR